LYTVQVTNGGVCDEFSAPYLYITVGLNSAISLHQIQVSPNPAVNEVFIDFGFEFSGSVLLKTVDGKVLSNSTCISVSKKKIDMTSLSKGIYFLEIKNAKQKKVLKLVKE
jgi:Secretion system C-terminal sorting domain